MTRPANVRVTVVATNKSEWRYNFKHPKSYSAAIKAALQQFAEDTKTSPRKAFFSSQQQGDFTKIVITFND